MAKVEDKMYTLSETEDKNQLLFYRNDKGILEGDLNNFREEVMRLFGAYITCKKISGELSGRNNFKIFPKMSTDRKSISLTFPERNNRKPNFFKHLIEKIFG